MLYDNSEFGLYQLEQELRNGGNPDTEVIVLLGSILNQGHLLKVLNTFSINVVRSNKSS